MKAWGQPLDMQESLAFAWACATAADSRLVPAVSTLLDPRQWQIRAYAIEALTKIDTEEAASASGRISTRKPTWHAGCG